MSYLVGLFHTRIKPELLKHKPLHEMKVLDFACSIGANSVIFKNLGVEVFGIDVSEKAIEKCIQGGYKLGDGRHFKAVNLLDPGVELKKLFNGMMFDLIIASECMYYFKNKERRDLLTQFMDVIEPHGIFYVSMPTYDFPLYRGYKDVEKDSDGMVEIKESGSISEKLSVNLPRSRNEMISMFEPFKMIDLLVTDEPRFSDHPEREYHMIAKK